MNEDRVILEIPHFEKDKQLKDYGMKITNDILKRQVNLVETYLLEFCEVNGIQESELKNHLLVASCVPDNSIMAINADDQRDVKFGVKLNVDSFEIFGEFLDCKDRFPKTLKLIEENGTETRNADNRHTRHDDIS